MQYLVAAMEIRGNKTIKRTDQDLILDTKHTEKNTSGKVEEKVKIRHSCLRSLKPNGSLMTEARQHLKQLKTEKC